MSLVSGIDFNELKNSLETMTFLVWGDITKSFFVAQDENEKDNAHVHIVVSGEDIEELLLTFVAAGKKEHPPAKTVDGDPGYDENWEFEFNDTEFNGDQIETALKQFGAKQADADSVQTTFSGITAAIGEQA